MLLNPINHRLISGCVYEIKLITWYKIGQLLSEVKAYRTISADSYWIKLIMWYKIGRWLSDDIGQLNLFRWKETKKQASAQLLIGQGKPKKTVHLCVFALRNYLEDYKINKPLSGLLVYRRIMPLAERLSSKSHSCPQSFTGHCFYQHRNNPNCFNTDADNRPKNFCLHRPN